jgi:hypothetical protein
MRISKIALLGCCMAMAMSASALATTIAGWTFEASVPTTAGPHAAEVGSGSALGFHASGSVVYSNPVGNGSAESFSSNFWTAGDYYQFQVDTTALQDITIGWHQTRSSTGPASFDLQYSTDGTTFTTFTSYTVPQVTWSSLAPEISGASEFFQDLSAISALDNDSSVYFRLTATVTPGSTGGTNRVDNITISGTDLVPEPTTFGLALASLGCLLIRRK